MKVVYIGNFGAPHSTENDLRKSFEQLGHQVDPWQEGEFLADVAVGQVAHRLQTADLVMHTMTQGSYGPADTIVALWETLRLAGIKTASYHLDRFYGLSSPKDSGPQRSELPAVHPMFKVDHVFTADGDHQADFERDGVNHHFLRPGVLAEEAHDSEAYPPWVGRWDVAFVGSSGYHPEWPHRPEMVQWLRDTYGDRFIHIGPGSTQTVTDDSGHELDRLRGHWLNRFYASVPVTVGDSCLLRRDGYYTSDRPYECWGRGGFLIHPGVYGLVEAIGDYPGHSWNPGDWDALRFEIDRCLADEHVRDAYRTRLAEEVRAHHTYTHRVQAMLDVIFAPPTEGANDVDGDGAADHPGGGGLSAAPAVDLSVGSHAVTFEAVPEMPQWDTVITGFEQRLVELGDDVLVDANEIVAVVTHDDHHRVILRGGGEFQIPPWLGEEAERVMRGEE